MKVYSEEQKMRRIKIWSCLVSAIIFIVVFISVMTFILNSRVVGEIKDNTLYYNGNIYSEVYEFIDIDTGRCLGTITWDDGSTAKIYKLKGYPDYIYLSMSLDHRIYKISSQSSE